MESFGPNIEMTGRKGHGIVFAEANTGNPLKGDFKRMARRRFQHGSVFLRGTRELVWVGRWREDVIEPSGKLVRIRKTEVLGTKKDLPTKKLALRELGLRLAPINSGTYRALRAATFAEFADLWKHSVLTQHKPATQSAVNSNLKNWFVPYFGDYAMKDIGAQNIQMFVRNCPLSPKSCLNLILTLRMMWKSAKAWGYVSHNPFDGLVLPKITQQRRFFFTIEEIQRIIKAAEDPHKILYWLAAETGMRAGELFGLRVEDVDLEGCVISVRQTVWRNVIQTPKTANSIRQFAISAALSTYLRSFLSTWRPNLLNLVFATRGGKPLDRGNLVARKLHPLLDSLKVRRCGLHAFRHTNGSLMDRLQTPMKVRQERLGHAPGSDITMAVYTHTVREDDRKIAQQLGEILDPNGPKFSHNETPTIQHAETIQ
jgi:integrase